MPRLRAPLALAAAAVLAGCGLGAPAPASAPTAASTLDPAAQAAPFDPATYAPGSLDALMTTWENGFGPRALKLGQKIRLDGTPFWRWASEGRPERGYAIGLMATDGSGTWSPVVSTVAFASQDAAFAYFRSWGIQPTGDQSGSETISLFLATARGPCGPVKLAAIRHPDGRLLPLANDLARPSGVPLPYPMRHGAMQGPPGHV